MLDRRTKATEPTVLTRAESVEGHFGTSVPGVAARLRELGGVATRADLVVAATDHEIARALRDGTIIRTSRGRYALPSVDTAVRIAHSVRGILCLSSAAMFHGWAVKLPSDRPHVSFPRNRRLTTAQLGQVHAHRHDLHPDDVVEGVATTKEATLLHCLRSLPDDEALAVADSAARSEGMALLHRVAATARGRGAARVRRIASVTSPDAANAFESVLRAIGLTVEGLHLVPQRLITSVDPWACPDLVDIDLRIVAEADSFEWHGDRAALRRDARRYDALVADGWAVLRFTWEDVMLDQAFVRRILADVVALQCGPPKPPDRAPQARSRPG